MVYFVVQSIAYAKARSNYADVLVEIHKVMKISDGRRCDLLDRYPFPVGQLMREINQMSNG